MFPVSFPGATEVKKPADMTDKECMSIWALHGFDVLKKALNDPRFLLPGVLAGVDAAQFPFYLTAWKPSFEDLQALNRGESVYIKTICRQLPPMAVFTLDENGQGNF